MTSKPPLKWLAFSKEKSLYPCRRDRLCCGTIEEQALRKVDPPVVKIPTYPMCFLCGKDNPIGLKVEFIPEGNKVRTEFTPGPEHQGFKGVMHGGLISALLDETMGFPGFMEGTITVTTHLEVTFRRPAPIGTKLIVTAENTKSGKRVVEAKGVITTEDGTVIAEGKGKYYRVPPEQQKEMEKHLVWIER